SANMSLRMQGCSALKGRRPCFSTPPIAPELLSLTRRLTRMEGDRREDSGEFPFLTLSLACTSYCVRLVAVTTSFQSQINFSAQRQNRNERPKSIGRDLYVKK